MFGLDDKIAALSSGDALLAVLAVSLLLGLRHATDPDHLTAVSTLIASGGGERRSHPAARLGMSWGLGHATSLFAFGLPIVLFRSYLPAPVQAAAEIAVGVTIAALAIRLLLRWRAGCFRAVSHSHGHGTAPAAGGRSSAQAYCIGLIHGMGGSAGIGLLLLAGIPNRLEATAALTVFALFTAISMCLASSAFGYTLSRGSVLRRFIVVAPVFGALSLAFGVWYGLGAAGVVPYAF